MTPFPRTSPAVSAGCPGLRQVDELIAGLRPDEGTLRELVDKASLTCRDALREARG